MDAIFNLDQSLVSELNIIGQSHDVEMLRGVVRNATRQLRDELLRLAVAMRRLEELGEPLGEFESRPYVRKVGYGQLLPEVLIAFQEDKRLLDRVASLPLAEQRKLADGAAVKVMLLGGDSRMVPPLELSRGELKRVFGNGRLRTEAEQVGMLLEEESRPLAPEWHQAVEVKRGKGIQVRANTFISEKQLLELLVQVRR